MHFLENVYFIQYHSEKRAYNISHVKNLGLRINFQKLDLESSNHLHNKCHEPSIIDEDNYI